jgi:hypothetical protein
MYYVLLNVDINTSMHLYSMMVTTVHQDCRQETIKYVLSAGSTIICGNTTSTRSTISAFKRKVVSQGHITLGFHLCGDGTSRAHKKVMQENAIKYGEAIKSSSL